VAAETPVLRFGTDGIRGRAHDTLSPDAVALVGRAAALVLGTGSTFLLARDTRESGPEIEAALTAGLVAEGAHAEPVGVFPTPGLAYLCQVRGLPGAMISASHNPFHDNGIKFFAPGGRKIADADERAIEARMATLEGHAAPPTRLPSSGPPSSGAAQGESYLAHVVGALEGRRLDGLNLVVDCANGAACVTAPLVLARLGAHVHTMADDPDGTNINSGCGSTHPEALQKAVVEAGADAGLAFDGDADRLVAVDEQGELVDGDHILAVAGIDLRDRGRLPHDTVVTTVMANLGFRRAADAAGIRVVETRVGDRAVLEAMDEGGYALGGEQSGHVIFADLATTGDGLLTAVMLLDVVARRGVPLSDLASVVQKLPQVLLNVGVADRDGLEGADAFWSEVRSVEGDLSEAGRVLVRPSGTEPVVRIMVEAPTEAAAGGAAERLAGALVEALGEPGSR